MAKTKAQKHHYLPIILLGLAVSGLGVGAVALVRSFLNAAPPQGKKVVQEIHVIRPPPPPPDLPPPPPPPEEKVDIPDPQQQPDPTPSNEPPPSEQLGLDAEGSAGGDAFGLVGHKGGRELLATGGSAMAWYANQLTGAIRDCLSADPPKGDMRVQTWVREDGSVERVRLPESSGAQARNKSIEARLEQCRFPAPPAGTPQPITLRIVSRG